MISVPLPAAFSEPQRDLACNRVEVGQRRPVSPCFPFARRIPVQDLDQLPKGLRVDRGGIHYWKSTKCH